jgi:hypothetical protein
LEDAARRRTCDLAWPHRAQPEKKGQVAMTVQPFHSKLVTDVYHNNNKCTVGDNIEPSNKVSGTGGKHLCSQCKDFNAQGK